MPKLVTFVDSSVLITAARGQDAVLRKRALDVLADPNREFAASVFVQLEVMPKALWTRNQVEQQVYEDFFNDVKLWPSDTDAVIAQAQKEAAIYGLGSMDALHIAAALLLKADELVTMEKPTKSIHRTKSIKVVSLR
jgi:predicted nucleic acid-binding protein